MSPTNSPLIHSFALALGLISAAFCVFPMTSALAQEETEISEIVVSENPGHQLRLRKNEINRVEAIKFKDLQKKQAQTFSQLIDNEKGIDSQTSCAFCGAKRITINGLKGEHTTILVDGLPLHSTVSGFYGVEAIPLGGIDSIEIYRGSGAALTAPESIGGAINIVTKDILTSSAEGTVSLGLDGQKNASVSGTRKIGENTGFLLGVQAGEIRPFDQDHNGISEAPRQNTQSVLTKVTHKINATDDLSLRLSFAQLKTVGGSMFDREVTSPVTTLATSDDFLDRDVREKFIGDEDKITENIRLNRSEAALIYRGQLKDESTYKLALGGASQSQQSIYSHGYDYDNQDRLWVALVEYQRALNEDHLLTLGIDTKNEQMNSDSQALYLQAGLKQDDLRSSSTGVFAQDTWMISDDTEMSVVLRLDQIRTQWLDLDRDLNRSLIAPRIFLKHIHNDVLTSRASYGTGYRSPLTLFESQHGTYHDGFEIDIRELEKSHSLVYSLAGQWEDDFFELGTHVTRIENMAVGMDRADQELPTLFVNSDEAYTVSVFDFGYGRRIHHGWTLEGLLEIFDYPSGYKNKLPVAAIERRLSLTSNVTWGAWSANQKLIFIGERDLSAYGYGSHYNIAYTDMDILSPTFEQTFAFDQKRQKAPAYFTLDLNFERTMSENYSLGFGVLNAFDYTQTGAGDSPTTWDLHGKHYHLDNFHVWGPLRGRQFFLTAKAVF